MLNSGVTGTIDTQGNNMTITGVISGAGGLTEIGGGNLTLTANDTFSGATTVSGGTLTITGNGGAVGVLPNTAITVAAGGTLVLNGQDVLGYNNTNLLTVYGTLDKVYNQSETVYQPILLSGGTMTSSGTFGTPNGAWDWFGGNISTAFGTTNFINGTGNFSLRSAAAYLNLGAGSTLNISVPITQNTNSGGTPLNVEGAGTLILSGTNTYTQPMQVGYNSTAGNLEFQGISVSSFTATGDGEFNLAYGSTLYISGSARDIGERPQAGGQRLRFGRQRGPKRRRADDHRQRHGAAFDYRRIPRRDKHLYVDRRRLERAQQLDLSPLERRRKPQHLGRHRQSPGHQPRQWLGQRVEPLGKRGPFPGLLGHRQEQQRDHHHFERRHPRRLRELVYRRADDAVRLGHDQPAGLHHRPFRSIDRVRDPHPWRARYIAAQFVQ